MKNSGNSDGKSRSNQRIPATVQNKIPNKMVSKFKPAHESIYTYKNRDNEKPC